MSLRIGDRIEPGPLPFALGKPESGGLWALGGGKPDGLEFLGCTATLGGFMMPCPCCCIRWVRVIPDSTQDGYAVCREDGCRGTNPYDADTSCTPQDIAWWHSWRCGDLPPSLRADARDESYAGACIRRVLTDLPEQPNIERMLQAAYRCGQWLEAGGLQDDLVLPYLAKAAERGELDSSTTALKLEAALMAGRAKPGSRPR